MANSEKELEAEQYKAQIRADIEACVSSMACQPILFIGSGLSKRYFSGPSWDELLNVLAGKCPLVDKDYAYYKQTLKNPIAIGEEFARIYQQWAWGGGRDEFPAAMFSEDVSEQAYIKHVIALHIASLTPASLSVIVDKAMSAEITALQAIKPHAVITTNYDQFLELVFPEYQPIVGQMIIHGSPMLFGELFKIHGCVSNPNSLVFTRQDYDEFTKKKKYLSAKLLTFSVSIHFSFSVTVPRTQTFVPFFPT